MLWGHILLYPKDGFVQFLRASSLGEDNFSYKNHITQSYRPILRPILYFFYPCRLGFPVPPRVGPACFRFFRPGKQLASNFIDEGMGGQPNGGGGSFVSRFFVHFRVCYFKYCYLTLICTESNGSKYGYVIPIILFWIQVNGFKYSTLLVLFAHS